MLASDALDVVPPTSRLNSLDLSYSPTACPRLGAQRELWIDDTRLDIPGARNAVRY